VNKVENCPICQKHIQINNTSKVYEGVYLNIYHGPLESKIVGYLYIEPKRHVENWYELTEQEILEIGKMTQTLSVFLKKEVNAERIYTVAISEAVRHLHIHVIPRQENETIKGLTLIEQATQHKVYTNKDISQQEIDIFINKINNHINGSS
jgi:diadenosine tetraphosphate (Ap4A) HIT family hydrolase